MSTPNRITTERDFLVARKLPRGLDTRQPVSGRLRAMQESYPHAASARWRTLVGTDALKRRSSSASAAAPVAVSVPSSAERRKFVDMTRSGGFVSAGRTRLRAVHHTVTRET